jgi:hypothetical protein
MANPIPSRYVELAGLRVQRRLSLTLIGSDHISKAGLLGGIREREGHVPVGKLIASQMYTRISGDTRTKIAHSTHIALTRSPTLHISLQLWES